MLGRLASTLMKLAAPLAKIVLAPLATLESDTAIDGAIQRKMYVQKVVTAGKGTTSIILNDIISENHWKIWVYLLIDKFVTQ